MQTGVFIRDARYFSPDDSSSPYYVCVWRGGWAPVFLPEEVGSFIWGGNIWGFIGAGGRWYFDIPFNVLGYDDVYKVTAGGAYCFNWNNDSLWIGVTADAPGLYNYAELSYKGISSATISFSSPISISRLRIEIISDDGAYVKANGQKIIDTGHDNDFWGRLWILEKPFADKLNTLYVQDGGGADPIPYLKIMVKF